MLEEKELNGQENLDVNNQSIKMDASISTNNPNSNVNMSYSVPDQTKAYVYMDSVEQIPEVTPVEGLDKSLTDNQSDIQILDSSSVSEKLSEDNPEIFTLDETIENDSLNSLGADSEVLNIVNEEQSIKEQIDVSENHDVMDKDLKNNFIFMTIFAVVILIIIFALPYISGYN